MKYCTRVRKVKTKGALLVLLWNFLVQATVFSPFTLYFYSIYSQDLDSSLVTALLQLTTLILFLPLFGWLADVYFGRYKVICYSMWLLWTAICSATLSLLLLYCFDHSIVLHAALYYAAVPLTVVCMHVGMAGMKANLIVFGMDQLQDSSTDEISAFVAWFVLG